MDKLNIQTSSFLGYENPKPSTYRDSNDIKQALGSYRHLHVAISSRVDREVTRLLILLYAFNVIANVSEDLHTRRKMGR